MVGILLRPKRDDPKARPVVLSVLARVVSSVRAQDCMIREITVPFVEEDKLRKTIKYQAESFFTSHSIDDPFGLAA